MKPDCRGPLVVAATFLLFGSFTSSRATAANVPIYQFCAEQSCGDGANPLSGATVDQSGNVFAAASSLGKSGGAIVMLQPNQNTYVSSVIHVFCSKDNCADGQYPKGKLITDVNGNVYGTAEVGGPSGGGLAYRLDVNTHGSQWKMDILYRFCTLADCTDGQSLSGGLTYQGQNTGVPYDGVSPLYGTAFAGGAHNQGLVYQISFKGVKPVYKVLYDFCSKNSCTDGAGPQSQVTIDRDGNIFGTTTYGGTGSNGGTVFELSPVNGKYAETVLYSFCKVSKCGDGRAPIRNVVFDSKGNIYGATSGGGKGVRRDKGVLFKIKPKGAKSTEQTVYQFCSTDLCADGSGPDGDLTIDGSDAVYGTTYLGGQFNRGVIYKIHGQSESVVYSFCGQSKCSDGANPTGGITPDGSGNYFGTTYHGGNSADAGIVYKFTP